MIKEVVKSGLSDLPKYEIKEDLFSIQKYVDGLSEFISVCQTPMTISIQGDWGSGKTSFMYMIMEKLRKEKIQTIEINTWQFAQFNLGEKLPIVILTKLIKELGAKKDTNFWKYVQVLLEISESAGVPFAKVATSINKHIAEKDKADITDIVSALKSAFEKVVKAKIRENGLEKGDKVPDDIGFDYSGKRVVIFIDDLDRLEPRRAMELLEVFKIFLDCEYVVFVLAIDYDVVVQGVYEKYKLDKKKGKYFFDKIIQLPFKMPISQFDINNYLLESLKTIGVVFEEKNKGDVEIYNRLISNSITYNPRAMKRLFNSYQLLLIINKSSEITSINNYNTILLAVLCMQIAYEDLYNYISASDNTEEAISLLTEISRTMKENEDISLKEDDIEQSKENEEESFSSEYFLLRKLSELELINDEINTSTLIKFLDSFINAIEINQEDLSSFEYDNLFRILKTASITQRTEGTQKIRRKVKIFGEYKKLPINYEIVNNGDLKNWNGSLVKAVILDDNYIAVKDHTEAFVQVIRHLYNKHKDAFMDMFEESKSDPNLPVIRSVFHQSKTGKQLASMVKIPDISDEISVGTKTNVHYKLEQLINLCEYLNEDLDNILFEVSLIKK